LAIVSAIAAISEGSIPVSFAMALKAAENSTLKESVIELSTVSLTAMRVLFNMTESSLPFSLQPSSPIIHDCNVSDTSSYTSEV